MYQAFARYRQRHPHITPPNNRSVKNYLLRFSQMFAVTLEEKNVSQVPLKNGSGEPGALCSGIQRSQAQIYTPHRWEGSACKVFTEV